MSEKTLVLLPRDGMFCKDGRGWRTSASGRGEALSWPFPSTLLGSVRTRWGYEQQEESGEDWGRKQWLEKTVDVSMRAFVALRRPMGEAWTAKHRMWSVPVDALYLEQSKQDKSAGKAHLVTRLNPSPNPASVSTMGLRRDDVQREEAREGLWRPRVQDKSKPMSAPAWWSDEEMVSWLSGGTVSASSSLEDEGRKLQRRREIHVTMDNKSRTAQKGGLFSSEVVETLTGNITEAGNTRYEEWALGVEVSLPGSADHFPQEPLGLGSKRRLLTSDKEVSEGFLREFPPSLKEAFGAGSHGLRLVTATPTEFKQGWLPDGFSVEQREGESVYVGHLLGLKSELQLRAACCGRPVHVSGWDMANRRPKPTRRLVAPGSVYFFTKTDGSAFTAEEAEALWMKGQGKSSQEGFGFCLPGIWNVENTEK